MLWQKDVSSSAILLIEPDPESRSYTAQLLVDEGYAVLYPRGPALTRAADLPEHCDLILVDVFLPRRWEFDMIRDVKARRPGVGIIALSENRGACRAESSLAIAAELGADAGLVKPVPPDTLLQRVRALAACANVYAHCHTA